MKTAEKLKTWALVASFLFLSVCLARFALLGVIRPSFYPKLVCDEQSIDFGPVSGGTVSHVFCLTNAGAAPLEIERVKAECGCTHVDFRKASIPVGTFRELGVSVRLNRRRGDFQHRVLITSNDPDNPSTVLRLTGTVTD